MYHNPTFHKLINIQILFKEKKICHSVAFLCLSYLKNDSLLCFWQMLSICQLHANEPHLTHQMLSRAQQQLGVEAKTNVLQGLSVLQICLVRQNPVLIFVYRTKEADAFSIYLCNAL